MYKRNLYFYCLIIIIPILDQLSKIYAVTNLKGGAAVPILHGILSFRYHENRGAAWGMFADQRWVFMTASTIAIVGIVAYLAFTVKQKHPILYVTSLSLFAGGGIGNMIDRVRLGYVIDFLRFDFIDFPIFNVADSFITIGACLMVLYLILETIREARQNKDRKASYDPQKKQK